MTLPGPPPTVNHSYKIVRVPRKDGGGLVSKLAKADGIETYQTGVTLITRTSRPTGWVPGDRIRLRYWFRLNKDVDCDNALKAINDAIAAGLGVNDKIFLPCVQEKTVSKGIDPHVIVEIENE